MSAVQLYIIYGTYYTSAGTPSMTVRLMRPNQVKSRKLNEYCASVLSHCVFMRRPINESGFIDRPAYGFNTVQLLLLHDASSRLTVTAVFASSSAKTRLRRLTHFFRVKC